MESRSIIGRAVSLRVHSWSAAERGSLFEVSLDEHSAATMSRPRRTVNTVDLRKRNGEDNYLTNDQQVALQKNRQAKIKRW